MASKAKYKQRPDGKFEAKVFDGTYVDGKKHYIRLYSTKSSKDLENKVLDYTMKLKEGADIRPSEKPMIDYARNWLKVEKANVEKATLEMYETKIEKSLLSMLERPFSALNFQLVQFTLNSLKDRPRTCQQASMTLKQILKSAELDKLIPRGKTDEIYSRITLPKYSSAEKRPLTDEEKTNVLNAKMAPREHAFVHVLYYMGLRREEALALTVADINLDKKQMSINKAVGFDKHLPYIKVPKSERGTRTIPMPEPLVKILTEYLDGKSDLLFEKQGGGLVSKSAYNSLWKNIKQQTGCPDITAHIFRHNYCTMLCYQAATKHNITTKKIAELMGDTEEMVIKVYSHIIEELENVQEALDNIFNETKKQTRSPKIKTATFHRRKIGEPYKKHMFSAINRLKMTYNLLKLRQAKRQEKTP